LLIILINNIGKLILTNKNFSKRKIYNYSIAKKYANAFCAENQVIWIIMQSRDSGGTIIQTSATNEREASAGPQCPHIPAAYQPVSVCSLPATGAAAHHHNMLKDILTSH
jgi:hypothetical protein